VLIDGAFAWVAWLVATPVLLFSLRRVRHLTVGHLLVVAVLATYLTTVVAFTILPFRVDAEYRMRPPFDPVVVIEPFFLGRPEAMSLSQYVGNVVLGIPFGLLVPFLRRMPLPQVLVAGLGFSLVIEAFQWVATKLMLAFPSRAVDINDVILNTVGVLIGVAAFAVVRLAYRTHVSGTTSPPRAWEHFHATLLGRTETHGGVEPAKPGP